MATRFLCGWEDGDGVLNELDAEYEGDEYEFDTLADNNGRLSVDTSSVMWGTNSLKYSGNDSSNAHVYADVTASGESGLRFGFRITAESMTDAYQNLVRTAFGNTVLVQQFKIVDVSGTLYLKAQAYDTGWAWRDVGSGIEISLNTTYQIVCKRKKKTAGGMAWKLYAADGTTQVGSEQTLSDDYTAIDYDVNRILVGPSDARWSTTTHYYDIILLTDSYAYPDTVQAAGGTAVAASGIGISSTVTAETLTRKRTTKPTSIGIGTSITSAAAIRLRSILQSSINLTTAITDATLTKATSIAVDIVSILMDSAVGSPAVERIRAAKAANVLLDSAVSERYLQRIRLALAEEVGLSTQISDASITTGKLIRLLDIAITSHVGESLITRIRSFLIASLTGSSEVTEEDIERIREVLADSIDLDTVVTSTGLVAGKLIEILDVVLSTSLTEQAMTRIRSVAADIIELGTEIGDEELARIVGLLIDSIDLDTAIGRVHFIQVVGFMKIAISGMRPAGMSITGRRAGIIVSEV